VVCFRILSVERGDQIRLARQLEIEAVFQFRIVAGLDADGEPGLERSNSRNCPAVENLAPDSLIFGYRNFPEITQNKAVAGVKQRQCTVAAAADRPQAVFEAGRVVDGLTEGIGKLELHAVTESFFERCLQRGVTGVGDSVLRKDAGEDRNSVGRATYARGGLTSRRTVGT